MTTTAARPAAAPHPTLSVWDAIMITLGIVIGAGIFRTPAEVAGIAGSPLAMMAIWVGGGILSLIGALTYAELASTYPSAGGDYSFLTRAYGRHVSFFFAWARSTVIVTGSLALLGFVVGDYLSRILHLGPYSSAIYAGIAVVALTAMNLAGLRQSARTQTVLTVIEVIGVLLVAVAALTLGPGEAPAATPADTGLSPGALGLALVFVLLTYGGWNEVAYVSAEIKGGARAIVRMLTLSIATITAIYVVFVGSLLYGLGFDELRNSEAVGATVMARALGPAGLGFISMAIAVAALASMNATMLAGARSNYAVAHDWPLLGFMRGWQDERNTPAMGFIVQGAIALGLIVFGAFETDGFSTMVEFTAPVFWFFFMLTGLALFVLRRKDPDTPRPFKVPLYPVLPLVFVAMCAYLLYSSITYAQSQNAGWVAIGVALSGVVAWLFMLLGGGGERRA